MDLVKRNTARLRGFLAGAVVLASAAACSRSDRSETGSANGAVTTDTISAEAQTSAPTPPQTDTGSVATTDTASTTAAAPAPAPRAETGVTQDTSTAGYRGMERDTGSAGMPAPRDTARATTDSAVAPGEQSTVAPADTAPMEVATPAVADTSVSEPDVAVQEDTATAHADVTVEADSSVEMAGAAAADSVADTTAGYTEMARDTSTMPPQADTARAAGAVDVAVASSSDSTVQVGDSSNVGKTGERLDPAVATAEENDTLTETAGEPIRPPEDSSEVYGNVTGDSAENQQDVTQDDRETVAVSESETDASSNEVGAAAIGGHVNGADAVALMTRQGAQCIVVDPESEQGVALDMSETPATLNPCGLGSMVPTRIWTKKE